MATWNANVPTITNGVSADISDIRENLNEIKSILEGITNGTVGSTEPASFEVDQISTSPDYNGTTLTATASEINTACDGITATASEINTACDGITATASEINTAADGISDPPIAGDSTAGRVLRTAYVQVEDGTNASTIKMTVTGVFNGDDVGAQDNISGGDVGNYNYGGSGLFKILASGITGNCVGVIAANLYRNSTGTDVTVRAYALGNNICFLPYAVSDGSAATTHTLVDSGDLYIEFTYLTDA
jgi:hypothetical protein